jgi:hypothetical protein
MAAKNLPTVPQATKFQQMFDYFNQELFDGKLHSCMLVFSRNANVIGGYFSEDKWQNEETGDVVHEIGLNANAIRQQSFLEVADTIIHEMVHLEQHLNGTSSRRGYHNQAFMDRCKEIGLKTEGKGQLVSTSIEQNGKAEQVALEMPDDILFDWTANELNVPGNDGQGQGQPEPPESKPRPTKSGSRSTYQCPVCGCKAWGKHGLHIICGNCDKNMIESN